MSMRLSAAVAACVVLSAAGRLALAQEAPPPASPTPAPPAAEATPLPPVVVETKQEAPKAKAKAKKKGSTASAAAASQPAPATQSPTSGGKSDSDKTAYGPVKNYVASNTATGIKTDTPLKEIPQSVTVVGKEQIRDQGAQTLQDTLRYTAGVNADGYGLDSRNDGVFVRGIEATQFLDGLRRTYGYYTSTIPFEPYALERVEVLRGPASVMYGQSTVGGILNMVSKRPQAVPYREVTVEYGSYDFKQIKTDMTGPLTQDGKWLYRVVGLARDAETQTDFVDNDRLLFAPSLTYRPTNDTSITFLADFRNDHTGSTAQGLPIQGALYPTAFGRLPLSRFVGEPSDRYDTEASSGAVIIDHKFNDYLSFHQGFRYTDTHNVYDSQFTNTFLDPTFRTIDRYKYYEESNTRILTSDSNLVAKFATGPVEHKLLGGFDYTRFADSGRSGGAINATPFDLYNPVYGQPETLLDPNTLAPISEMEIVQDPDGLQQQKGLYVQDQIKLGPWIAVVGLRQDWVTTELTGSPDEEAEALTRRAGLMYEFDFGLTPYVSYSESFIPVFGAQLSSGGGAKPLEGESIEVGFKYQPAGANFIINGAVYDITERNRLSSPDIFDPSIVSQSGEVSIRGFEIEAIGQVTQNLKAIATYSYTGAKYVIGNDPAQNGKRVESVPDHLASLWLIYTFDEGVAKGFSFGGGVRYVGESWDGYDLYKTPPATLFDAMLAYETDAWRWSLNAVNLEDKYQINTCLNRGDCWIGTARTITTGLTYKF